VSDIPQVSLEHSRGREEEGKKEERERKRWD
jgi:hypothetical protein